MNKPTLEQDVKTYTDALNAAPNAWGQHMIGQYQSHGYLNLMVTRHGSKAVEDALNAHYAKFK